MKTTSVAALAALLSGCAISVAAPSGPAWLETGIRQASSARQVTHSVIGASGEGRPIHLLRVGSGEPTAGALLIVAGLDGRHRVGSEAALALAGRLAEMWDELPEGRVVYIIPAANPDNAAWQLDGAHPTEDFGGVFVAFDDDRDRRIDEDGPQDLNGDGVITMMRVADPPIGSGLVRTHVIDEDEPRLMREPKSAEGESPTHALLIEGRDVDGDGRIGEDGRGGVLLNHNFPYRWPEHVDDAGQHQLSQPESLALVRWMLEHDEITTVLVYGPDDTLVSTPVAGKTDDTRRVPLGILDEDKAVYEMIGARFKEITGIQKGGDADLPGSLLGWSYAQFGAFTFGTSVWVRPDLVEKKETKDEGEAEAPAEAVDGAAAVDGGEAAPDAAPEPVEGAPAAAAAEGAEGDDAEGDE
ncbi:MAG: hypothetical protein KDA21_04060, partial [Phycisphaerales bacterium]|nr:hypothetical protein [Phycisphaerales bacterium]